MKEMLMEIINDGEQISLMDGSLWIINPVDIPSVCTWIPTTEIEVFEDNEDPIFEYVLVNTENNIQVRAMKAN